MTILICSSLFKHEIKPPIPSGSGPSQRGGRLRLLCISGCCASLVENACTHCTVSNKLIIQIDQQRTLFLFIISRPTFPPCGKWVDTVQIEKNVCTVNQLINQHLKFLKSLNFSFFMKFVLYYKAKKTSVRNISKPPH